MQTPSPESAASPSAGHPSRLLRFGVPAALLLLAAAGSGAWWLRASEPAGGAAAADDFATVAKRSFPLEVTASGDLEAKNQATVMTPKGISEYGRGVISEVVPEGTVVKPGDVMCRLNTKELKEQEDRLKLTVNTARADLVVAEQNLELEKENCAGAEQSAQDKFEAAKTDLRVWEQGTDAQKCRELKLALETAKRELDIAEREDGNNQALFAKRFISQSDLEKSGIALITAKEKLETAKLGQRIYLEFTQKKELAEKRVAVGQAELTNAQAKKQTEGKMVQARSKRDGAKETLSLNEKALATIQEAIASCVIRAPQNGIVIYSVQRWGGDGPLAPGQNVYPGQPLIVLPDTSQMNANLRVHEAQIQRVAVGQAVSVSINARPGRTYSGKVVKKADTADTDRFNPYLAEYVVKVELPKDVDNELKPGMSCRGVVRTGEVKDALTLPVQAVFAEDGARYAWVGAGGGKVRRQAVEIADAGLLYAVVKAGLKEGDRVLLRAPAPDEVAR